MAVMTSQQRADCFKALMEKWSSRRTPTNGNIKADCKAALDASDQWCSDNAASFNANLPTAFKNGASATLKSDMLEHVIAWRRMLGV